MGAFLDQRIIWTSRDLDKISSEPQRVVAFERKEQQRRCTCVVSWTGRSMSL